MTSFTTTYDRPKWHYALSAFEGKEPGVVVTYEDIAAKFPGGDFDKDRDRSAVLTAADRLLAKDQRAIVAVNNVGYRVITAEEHYQASQKRRLRAKRQTRKAQRLAKNYRRDEVSQDMAERLDRMADRMTELERRLTRQERKSEDLEAKLDAATRKQQSDDAKTEARIARLEALLLRHNAA